MTIISRARRIGSPLVVFGLAFAVRLVHVWQMRETVFFSVLMGDSRGYDAWALQIAGGDWVGRDVFYQAPLYPYFLGIIYAAFGHDLLVVRIIQALIGALSCTALTIAVDRFVSPRAGVIAGLMLAFYPPAIFFDGLIQKSVLDVFFVCVALAIIAGLATHAPSPRRWFLLGVTMGALALTRENALLLVVVVFGWLLYRDRGETVRDHGVTRPPRRRGAESQNNRSPLSELRASAVVCFVGGVATVLLPVAMRNYYVGGGFYLTTSQLGSNLYIGNNPRADGSYMSLREGRGSPEFERVDATELAEEATGRELSAGEVSSYWTARTLAYIREHPGAWLELLARKARLLVSSTEIIDTESQESHAEYSTPLRVLGGLWHFGVLLPLAVLGVGVLWSERQRLTIVYVLALTYAATLVLFFVVARYRLALVPFTMVLAGGAAALLPDGLRNVPRVAWAAAAVLAIVSNWPLHTSASQMAITENNLAAALQEAGRTDDAIEHYRRTLALRPDYAPAINNLGTALRAAGRSSEALAVYERAIAARPADESAYVNKGNALMALGKASDAIAAYRQAVAVAPRSTHAATALANALYDEGTEAIERGDFERAVAALREAVALRPAYAEAHNNLGIALASDGKLQDAIAEWETALRLNPNFADARRNLSLARGQGR
jgi:tetratricopeptide (TPR) repeat protein